MKVQTNNNRPIEEEVCVSASIPLVVGCCFAFAFRFCPQSNQWSEMASEMAPTGNRGSVFCWWAAITRHKKQTEQEQPVTFFFLACLLFFLSLLSCGILLFLSSAAINVGGGSCSVLD